MIFKARKAVIFKAREAVVFQGAKPWSFRARGLAFQGVGNCARSPTHPQPTMHPAAVRRDVVPVRYRRRMEELDVREQAILAVERQGWAGPGAKERAIRERLGLAPVRYYQLLNALLDDPRALAHDPVTVNRLRRVREGRRAER